MLLFSHFHLNYEWKRIFFFFCLLWGDLVCSARKKIWFSSAWIAWGTSASTEVHSVSVAFSLQVILSELYSTGFQRSFSDDDDLTAIADSDVVYAFQAPPLYSRGGSAAPHSGNHSNRKSVKNDNDCPQTSLFPSPAFSSLASLCPLDELFSLIRSFFQLFAAVSEPLHFINRVVRRQTFCFGEQRDSVCNALCILPLILFLYAW